MKTILVLTDFSINADYAAQYALQLAQKIEANLLLCNIYELPQGGRMADRAAWPLEACEKNSMEDLGELTARLKTLIDRDRTGLFRPEVNQCSYEGAVADRINEIARKHEVTMAVISRHDASWLSTLISGNHTRDIIEAANFPVMLIPYQVRFNDYKTIAFATAMNYTDISILQSLTGLAKYMDAKIMITSVDAHSADEEKETSVLKTFFTQIPDKIAYPKIIYQVLKDNSVMAGLSDLTKQVSVDLLVLVHRRRNYFQKLFDAGVTEKLAVFMNMPLLIFPCYKVKETLTVF